MVIRGSSPCPPPHLIQYTNMPVNSIIRFAAKSSSDRTPPATPSSTSTTPIFVIEEPIDRPSSLSPVYELESDGISQEPPSIEQNASCRFIVDWQSLRYNYRPLVGQIGWRIRHKRQQGGEGKVSPIWLHGADLLWSPPGKPAKRLFLCKRCHQARQHHSSTFIVNGTAHIFAHLLRSHHIDSDGIEQTHEAPTRRSPWDSQPCQQGLRVLDDDFNGKSFSLAYPDWVLKQNISYNSATSDDTISLFTKARPGIEVAMYKSHYSLSSVIQKAYKQRQLEIKDLLLTSKSQITISCDIWTSDNNMSLLGVVAHFLDANDQRQTVLVGLPRLFGHHSGENIASTVCKVLDEYEITDKVSCFMMDNASNNGTMIDAVIKRIPSLKRRARLRCVGHIFNLIVKAILYGRGITDFEKRILGCSDREHFDLWRRLGAIGKIHNFVKWILRSTQRREEFCAEQRLVMEDDEIFDWQEKVLLKDGGVRWNSTYMMLKRAKLLRKVIEWFQMTHEAIDDEDDIGYGIIDDGITKEDWEEVDLFLSVLEPIANITKELEGNPETSRYGSLWAAFPALNVLSDVLDDAITKTKEAEDSYFKSGILMGKQKLDQYWDKMTQETPIYFAATILNPTLKEAYFKDKWRKYPEWQKRAKQQMEKIFREYIEKGDDEDEITATRSSAAASSASSASSSQNSQVWSLKRHLKVDKQYSFTWTIRKAAKA